MKESDLYKVVRSAISKCMPFYEMKAYHGSKADFDHFSLAYMGTGNKAQEFGYGIYVTFDPEAAYGYGGRFYEVEILDVNGNNYLFYDMPVPEEIIEKIYQSLLEVNRYEYPDDFEDEQYCRDFMDELRQVLSPKEGRYVMYNIGKYVFEKTQVPMIMRNAGVDGFIYNNGKVDNAVIFDSRKIKILNKEIIESRSILKEGMAECDDTIVRNIVKDVTGIDAVVSHYVGDKGQVIFHIQFEEDDYWDYEGDDVTEPIRRVVAELGKAGQVTRWDDRSELLFQKADPEKQKGAQDRRPVHGGRAQAHGKPAGDSTERKRKGVNVIERYFDAWLRNDKEEADYWMGIFKGTRAWPKGE